MGRLLMAFAFIMSAVGIANYAALLYFQERIIEHEAIRSAEIVANHALTSRTVFTREIANKLLEEGFEARQDFRNHRATIPIPAQFLKIVAQEIRQQSSGMYSYKPLSRWNQDPTQGIGDDFQRWAWEQLSAQDQKTPASPISWRASWRFESVDGVRTLRYMRADPADATACVLCHNALEQTPDTVARRIANRVPLGKQWKQYQLLGAIEVQVPVDKIDNLAALQANSTLTAILGISLLGLATAGAFALAGMRQERCAAERFEHAAKYDPLTRLANRTLFNERALVAIEHAQRFGIQLSVVFIDLDGFKPINDTHGHAIGDQVLQEIGRRLVRALRSNDVVARQGGDEFLILLHGGQPMIDNERVAQKLLKVLEQPIDKEGISMVVSGSIGIASYPEHGKTVAALVERADAAMYAAKRHGGGYRVWTADLAS